MTTPDDITAATAPLLARIRRLEKELEALRLSQQIAEAELFERLAEKLQKL